MRNRVSLGLLVAIILFVTLATGESQGVDAGTRLWFTVVSIVLVLVLAWYGPDDEAPPAGPRLEQGRDAHPHD